MGALSICHPGEAFLGNELFVYDALRPLLLATTGRSASKRQSPACRGSGAHSTRWRYYPVHRMDTHSAPILQDDSSIWQEQHRHQNKVRQSRCAHGWPRWCIEAFG